MNPGMLLTIIVLGAVFAEPFLSLKVKSIAYALAITSEGILVFVLPFVIFSLVSSGVMQLRSRAVGATLLLITLICASNFTSTWIAYGISHLLPYGHIPTMKSGIIPLEPLWHIQIPKLLSNTSAILAGIFFSTAIILLKPELTKKLVPSMQTFAHFVLHKILMPLIPIFILGFIIKMMHSNELKPALNNYLSVLAMFALSTSAYLSIVYWILMGKKIKQARNMIPACITAFSTMSSAVAIPMLITAAGENTQRKDVVEPIIPSIVNFHLMGDCFFIPMVAIAILNANGMDFPSPYEYLMFSLQFVIAKFSVAAIPSGGIIVMLPLLAQSSFGFDKSMLSLITILYAIFDPFITSFNILGNGAFSMLFKKSYEKVVERYAR